jgi:hypothetical protein
MEEELPTSSEKPPQENNPETKKSRPWILIGIFTVIAVLILAGFLIFHKNSSSENDESELALNENPSSNSRTMGLCRSINGTISCTQVQVEEPLESPDKEVPSENAMKWWLENTPNFRLLCNENPGRSVHECDGGIYLETYGGDYENLTIHRADKSTLICNIFEANQSEDCIENFDIPCNETDICEIERYDAMFHPMIFENSAALLIGDFYEENPTPSYTIYSERSNITFMEEVSPSNITILGNNNIIYLCNGTHSPAIIDKATGTRVIYQECSNGDYPSMNELL